MGGELSREKQGTWIKSQDFRSQCRQVGYEEACKTLKLGRYLLRKGYAYTVQATIVIPYPDVPSVVRDCVAKGVKAALIITAGLGETGEEGIRLARAESPDLVLMDINLPDMDGLEATAVLKQDSTTRHIPVIAMTAHAMKGDKEEALAAGCAGYIVKPIETREFPKDVARFIDSAVDP